jgi:hypothetical protein
MRVFGRESDTELGERNAAPSLLGDSNSWPRWKTPEVPGNASQIPAARRRGFLIRADGAGATHELLDWLAEQGKVRGRRLSAADTVQGKGTVPCSRLAAQTVYLIDPKPLGSEQD